MGVTEKLWDALTTVIKMNDKIECLAGTVVTQQQKIEQLTERVIRLETALEIALATRNGPRRIEHKTRE
ncbi:MAG: hypothetical protein AB1412_15280 [Pseudomonadota bacterium]